MTGEGGIVFQKGMKIKDYFLVIYIKILSYLILNSRLVPILSYVFISFSFEAFSCEFTSHCLFINLENKEL